MKNGVIIQASSRSIGNTSKVVAYYSKLTGFDVIDLNKKNIKHFDYEFLNQDDDFSSLFKEIAINYNTIVFVTPIYWYTMSGLMKVFLDRISDFLKRDKDIGRELRGKQMAVLSSSESDEVFDGFSMPFEQSARYLGMDYLGHLHTYIENGEIPLHIKEALKNFASIETKIYKPE